MEKLSPQLTNEWLPPKLSNPKEFFILEDGIINSGYETVLSLFQRYRCDAGCDVCYIRDRWIDTSGNDLFQQYIPPEITPTLENNILHALSHFQNISCMDDMFLLKHHYPHLLEFYKKHGKRMHLTSMTDMALIQQAPVAVNDVDFSSIYEVSLSDYFLQVPAHFKAATKSLEMLYEKYNIVKLRFILTPDPTISKNNVEKLIKWANDRNIYTSCNRNIDDTWVFNKKIIDSIDHLESSPIVINDDLHQIFTEASLMLQDRWVLTFYQSTDIIDRSFYHMENGVFNPAKFLEGHVREKIERYKHTASVLERSSANAEYYDYFQYTSNHVQVNDNWNFIPRPFLGVKNQEMINGLLSSGFVDTPLGLIRTGTTTPIPIYSFK